MNPHDERRRRYRSPARRQARLAARKKARRKSWRDASYDIEKARRDGHYVEPE